MSFQVGNSPFAHVKNTARLWTHTADPHDTATHLWHASMCGVPRWQRGADGNQGADMIERKERKPYWRHTQVQMLASLLPFRMVIIVLPLSSEPLSRMRFDICSPLTRNSVTVARPVARTRF